MKRQWWGQYHLHILFHEKPVIQRSTNRKQRQQQRLIEQLSSSDGKRWVQTVAPKLTHVFGNSLSTQPLMGVAKWMGKCIPGVKKTVDITNVPRLINTRRTLEIPLLCFRWVAHSPGHAGKPLALLYVNNIYSAREDMDRSLAPARPS